MADVQKITTLSIKAETLGDLGKLLAAAEDAPASTRLVEPVEVSVHVGQEAQ